LTYEESFKELGRRLSINVEELALDGAPAGMGATTG
jgi:hypothetical protein